MEYADLLGNVPKDKFRQTINKLLNECFILKTPSDTASDYRLIMANRDVFEGVLDLLGYDLIIRDDQGVITINNPAGTGRIHFNKLESILILILRLLYIEKMKELSQVQDVIILIEEIYEKYDLLNIKRLRRDQLISALRRFKRVNIIQNLDRLDQAGPESRIQVYPSILLAITSSSLDEAYKMAMDRLNEYNVGEDLDAGSGDADEETD